MAANFDLFRSTMPAQPASRILATRCPHCAADVGDPCRSVGSRPIVDAHMRRLHDANALETSDSSIERVRYAEAVIRLVFGYCTPELLKLARRDRAIDVSKSWVKRALLERRARAEQELDRGGL